MAEALAMFLTFTAFGILLGRSWDFAALALCLTLLFAIVQVAN